MRCLPFVVLPLLLCGSSFAFLPHPSAVVAPCYRFETCLTSAGTTSTTSPSSTNTVASTSNDLSAASSISFFSESDQLRPLHQNWWPVSALTALDKSRPNELFLLGKPLVAFYSSDGSSDDHHNHDVEDEQQSTSGSWSVLDDRCSHRFAPLSEGRVLKTRKGCSLLQCAYHGWEFQANGTCVHVPQLQQGEDEKGTVEARSVATYPTRVRAGILWVWADPKISSSSSSSSSIELSESVPLPVNPLLDRWVHEFGLNAVFQRDLPYGMEILGENLLDLSHLPFAHHSVGSLRRSLGEGGLPIRMMNQQERIDYAQWEVTQLTSLQESGEKAKLHSNVIAMPTFQGEVVEASKHDPILKNIAAKLPPESTKDWRCTISFFSPSHVRYRRTRGPSEEGIHVELFFCPVSESRSRVFVINVFGGLLKNVDNNGTKAKKPIKERLIVWLLSKLFHPNRVQGHMLGHLIFDGDGIFLHKQGNRMNQAGLTFRDYSTPSSADILLNAYRRLLDRLAAITRQKVTGLEGESMANAVVGTGLYRGDLERADMLDRYNTHTKYCPLCRTALERARQQKARFQLLQTALAGATGAAALFSVLTKQVLSACLGTVSASATTAWTPSLQAVQWMRGLVVVTALGTYWAGRSIQKLEKTIQRFYFEDYVHAEKN